MTRTARRIFLVAATLGAVCLAAWQAGAEANRVTFPANFDQLVHYTTVTRSGVEEHMLTSREVIEAVKNGQPVPNGTHFVLVDYRDGKLVRYFVMQKGPDWGAEYEARRRTGDWQFQWFNTDKTTINMNENTNRCQSCHQAREDSEYLFTFNALRSFK